MGNAFFPFFFHDILYSIENVKCGADIRLHIFFKNIIVIYIFLSWYKIYNTYTYYSRVGKSHDDSVTHRSHFIQRLSITQTFVRRILLAPLYLYLLGENIICFPHILSLYSHTKRVPS